MKLNFLTMKLKIFSEGWMAGSTTTSTRLRLLGMKEKHE